MTDTGSRIKPTPYLHPACVIACNISPDGQHDLSWFVAPYAHDPSIRELVEATMKDIDNLPSIANLRAAIEALPRPTHDTITPQEAQATIDRNAEEARIAQIDLQEPLVLLLAVDNQGVASTGYAVSPEHSIQIVRNAALAAALSLTASPVIQILQQAVRIAGIKAN